MAKKANENQKYKRPQQKSCVVETVDNGYKVTLHGSNYLRSNNCESAGEYVFNSFMEMADFLQKELEGEE